MYKCYILVMIKYMLFENFDIQLLNIVPDKVRVGMQYSIGNAWQSGQERC